MAGVRPEIIFVQGPQAGERFVLMDNSLIAGRSASCGLKMTDDFVSRQQLSFALTPQGWVVENISASSKMEVAGKKYKAGKKIILETGDTIKVGAETELLFVAPGDDPDLALMGYRKNSDNIYAKVEPVLVNDSAEEVRAPAPEKKKSVPGSGQTSDESAVEKTPGGKMKKYMIFGGIYLAAMIGLFVFLSFAKSSRDTRSAGSQPPRLSAEQVADCLTGELDRSPNAEASARCLRLAREYFNSRSNAEKNLYLCVLNYRLYLGFRRKDQRTFEPIDERQMRIARSELIDKVMQIYDNAWALESGGHWTAALGEYEALLKYIPPEDIPELYGAKRGYDDAYFSTNIRKHMVYASKHLKKK